MGSVLFPIFKTGMSTENAWRSVCAVPAFVVLCWAGTMIFISDDSPKGNYDKVRVSLYNIDITPPLHLSPSTSSFFLFLF